MTAGYPSLTRIPTSRWLGRRAGLGATRIETRKRLSVKDVMVDDDTWVSEEVPTDELET
jgi:hypothetical protein